MPISDGGSEHSLLSDHNSTQPAQPDFDVQHNDDPLDFLTGQALEPIGPPILDDETVDPSFELELESSAEGAASYGMHLDKGKGKANDSHYDQLSESSAIFKDRPNRFVGPDINWRRWTEQERLASSSIDELRNRDLSIHLFNAHVLQLRKRRAIGAASRGAVLDPDVMFVPDRSWTSWPLPPFEVPRGTVDQVFDGDDTGTITSHQNSRSSQEFEECLVASAIQQAKDRFHSRLWADEDDNEMEAKKEAPAPSIPDDASVELDTGPMFSTQEARRNEEEEDDMPDEEDPTRPGRPSMYDMEGSRYPVFLADDERSRDLLLPSTKEIMALFDVLLEGLHRARMSYGKRMDQVLDHDESEGTNSNYWRKRRRVSRGKESRSRSSPGCSQGQPGDLPDNPRSQGGQARRTHTPATRDWSDVLTVAALGGWSQSVIDRTAKRCAELFDEDMQFTTLHEGPSRDEPSFITQATASGMALTDGMVPRSASIHDTSTTVEMSEAVEGPYGCPNQFCRRQGRSFDTIKRLSNHLQKHHPITPALSRSQLRSDVDTSVREADDKTTRRWFCPLRACRGQYKGFTRTDYLYNHVRKFHVETDVVEVMQMIKDLRKGLRDRQPSTSRGRSHSRQRPQQESYESSSNSEG